MTPTQPQLDLAELRRPTKEQMAMRAAKKPILDVLWWIADAQDDLDVLVPLSIYPSNPRLTIREFIKKMRRQS